MILKTKVYYDYWLGNDKKPTGIFTELEHMNTLHNDATTIIHIK